MVPLNVASQSVSEDTPTTARLADKHIITSGSRPLQKCKLYLTYELLVPANSQVPWTGRYAKHGSRPPVVSFWAPYQLSRHPCYLNSSTSARCRPPPCLREHHLPPCQREYQHLYDTCHFLSSAVVTRSINLSVRTLFLHHHVLLNTSARLPPRDVTSSATTHTTLHPISSTSIPHRSPESCLFRVERYCLSTPQQTVALYRCLHQVISSAIVRLSFPPYRFA